MSVNVLSPIERKIIRSLLDAAAARGLLVSVYDGEEWTLTASDSRPAIEAAMGTTESDTLRFRKPGLGADGKPESIGSVVLVYGNEDDLISDYSDNPETQALVASADANLRAVL